MKYIKDKIRFLQKYKNILILILLSFIFIYTMSFSFYDNKWGIVEQNWFNTWQEDSESFIIGRVNQSNQHGVFSHSGFIGTVISSQSQKDSYLNSEITTEFGTYQEQLGLQALLFSLIDKLTYFSPQTTLNIFYSINSIILSVLICIIFLWIKREYGVLACLIGFIFTFNSNWLIVSGKNLYWVTWSFLLPFVLILLLMMYEEKNNKVKNWTLFIMAYISIFLRSGCGYEFISSIMIITEIPLIYYAIKNKWNRKKYIERGIIVGIGSLLGFITAVITNIIRTSVYNNSFLIALKNLKYTISKRTGFFNIKVDPMYQVGLDRDILDVFNIYISEGNPIVFNWHIDVVISLFLFFIALTFISSQYSKAIASNRRKLIALSCITLITFTAPISWFVLAKGHSAIHTHINFILWSLPFTIIGFCLGGANISYLFKDIWKHLSKILKIFLLITIMLIFISIYIASYNKGYKETTYLFNNVLSNGIKCNTLDEKLDIYYYDNALYYVADKSFDIKDTFFLHITPNNINELPENRIQYGYDNYDFSFYVHQLNLPFWKEYKVAVRNIPTNYSISSIQTGQYNNEGQVWYKNFEYTDIMPQINYINPYNLTDENWHNGLSNDGKTILLNTNNIEYYKLIGKTLKLPNDDTVKINDVKIIDDMWVYIILDTSIVIENDVSNQLKVLN